MWEILALSTVATLYFWEGLLDINVMKNKLGRHSYYQECRNLSARPQVEGLDILMHILIHMVLNLLAHLHAHTHRNSFISCHRGTFRAAFPETMQKLQWRGKENILHYKNSISVINTDIGEMQFPA